MLSKCADLFFTVNNFHTARFAAAASVNLTFHYPRTGADFRCGFFCFTRGIAGITHRSR
ncbi:hypothetical protein D3C76_1602940 [compost metagenome]